MVTGGGHDERTLKAGNGYWNCLGHAGLSTAIVQLSTVEPFLKAVWRSLTACRVIIETDYAFLDRGILERGFF